MHVHTHTCTHSHLCTQHIYIYIYIYIYTVCVYIYIRMHKKHKHMQLYIYKHTYNKNIYTNTLSTCVHIYSQVTLSRTVCNHIAIHIKTSIIILPVQLDFLNTLVYPKTNKSHRGMLPITETLVLQTRSQNQYHNELLF